MSVANENSTIGGLDVITAVWADCCDFSIDVLAFSCGVLYGRVRANGDFR